MIAIIRARDLKAFAYFDGLTSNLAEHLYGIVVCHGITTNLNYENCKCIFWLFRRAKKNKCLFPVFSAFYAIRTNS